jgi:hypothetical protein
MLTVIRTAVLNVVADPLTDLIAIGLVIYNLSS